MKSKIINVHPDKLEAHLNKFLTDNPNINIINLLQSSYVAYYDGWYARVIITIIYKEKKNENT